MENPNQTNDLFDQRRPKPLPGMLNVLTILTFIGCGLGYIGTLWGYFTSTADKVEQSEAQMDKLGDNAGFARKFLEDTIDYARVSYDHKTLLLITNLVFVTMCLIGALRMRKLKKSGFFVYTIGELAPVFLLGGLLTSIANINLIGSAFFAILFVILYATQIKHLVNK